jgi:hypothetical protein
MLALCGLHGAIAGHFHLVRGLRLKPSAIGGAVAREFLQLLLDGVGRR